MRQGMLITMLAVGALGGARPAAAQEALRAAAPAPADVPMVRADTLHDVALVRLERGQPVIYYNPVLLQRLGSELTAFFLAHEYGHVVHGHTGEALYGLHTEIDERRQRQELEADCYAARTLGTFARPVVEEAARLFGRMGHQRFDTAHPTGAQRAAKILACLPEPPPMR